MTTQCRRCRLVLACTGVAIGLLSATVVPATAGAGEGGRAEGVVTEAKKKKKKKKRKKCKKKGRSAARKKCKRPKKRPPNTPPTPPVGSPRPTTACGAPIAKSSGGYWECTFSDNFDGTTLDRSKWLPQRTDQTGYVHGPTACFVDRPDNISVSDGTLRLTARKESAPFGCAPGFTTQYTSGMVTTALGRFSQTYGRFEIRAKISPAQVKGLQTSLWLWPVDSTRYGPYPASGEIDIAEMFSQYPNRVIPHIHYKPLALVDPLATNTLCFISNLAEFHSYTLVWTETNITISYDGNACLANYWIPALPLTHPQPFDQPFFILLTQALGVTSNEFDPETTPLPATTEVDYVRAWK
jgi:beta-glucanase (GH16 family)